MSPPTITATLDLSNPAEREAHDLVRRFGSGRWPLWRILGVRRRGSILYVAVKWQRCCRPDPYSLVEVALDSIAFSWRYLPSAVAARRALNQA